MNINELQNSSNNNPSHQGYHPVQDVAFIGPPEPPGLRTSSHPDLPARNAEQTGQAEETYREAAVRWFQFGFQVIPVLPETKQPACKWDPWLADLSEATIESHWDQYPEHELGFIVGPERIVFDADSPEAITAFHQLMASFDLTCNQIFETRKGEHYYFRRAAGTIAKSDSHDTAKYSNRLDIKTGRALIVLPPSTGKSELLSEAETASDLVEVGQDFIDAVYRHNGREAPRQTPEPRPPRLMAPEDEGQLATDIQYLLQHIEPDCGYEDWLSVGMAIQHESGGSDTGFQLFDEWSSQGDKYPGHPEMVAKWGSFNGDQGTPVTLGTLCKLAGLGGADLEKVGEEFFEPLDDDEIAALADAEAEEHELAKYSLRGMSLELEAEMLAHVFVLGMLAILGQWTVIYAPPNTGKTLIVLWLLIDAIKKGNIKPKTLFYINADDTHAGLAAKLKLAEKHGFEMLAPGYRDFRAEELLKLLRRLCTNGRARGTIVILDTLKKFTDLMDKRTASDFGSAIREFIAKGGTVIALAHVNKKRDSQGKPIYAGTSDIVDDADCAYTVDTLSEEKDTRTVQFENIKNRGRVAKRAAYQYSTAKDDGYIDILESVIPVDDAKAVALRDAAARLDDIDTPVIEAIADYIKRGVIGKGNIAQKVVTKTGCSGRRAQQVLDKYTGTNPEEHKWHPVTGPRGVKRFEMLPEPPATLDLDREEL
jgi:primase-like protein/bifunctional DNA primase/polymerase-like protein/AAA domain-containing protein